MAKQEPDMPEIASQWDTLPKHILKHIFEYIPIQKLLTTISAVNKTWAEFASKETFRKRLHLDLDTTVETATALDEILSATKTHLRSFRIGGKIDARWALAMLTVQTYAKEIHTLIIDSYTNDVGVCILDLAKHCPKLKKFAFNYECESSLGMVHVVTPMKLLVSLDIFCHTLDATLFHGFAQSEIRLKELNLKIRRFESPELMGKFLYWLRSSIRMLRLTVGDTTQPIPLYGLSHAPRLRTFELIVPKISGDLTPLCTLPNLIALRFEEAFTDDVEETTLTLVQFIRGFKAYPRFPVERLTSLTLRDDGGVITRQVLAEIAGLSGLRWLNVPFVPEIDVDFVLELLTVSQLAHLTFSTTTLEMTEAARQLINGFNSQKQQLPASKRNVTLEIRQIF